MIKMPFKYQGPYIYLTRVMANRAAKAEAKLQRICEQLGISQAGHFWLDHALDPFKDLVKPHPGYVDKTTEPSVVEVVKTSVVVTAPGAVNWDCEIFLDQSLISQYLYTTALTLGVYQRAAQGATPYIRGGLVCRKANTGTALDITTTDNASCLGVDTALYANEDCRVIGVGFEVHDTTQELKKQGTAVVWRMDQPTEQVVPKTVAIDAGTTACISSSTITLTLPQPPTTLAQALDMIGSRQWEAKEGAYVTPVQAADTNPPLGLRSLCLTCTEGANVYFPIINASGANNLITCNPANAVSPWSMSGAYFSGLDPSATLTINFNYFIERFPNKASAIRRLCYPSPQFDPRAQELYSLVARDMPVGVTVDQNSIGDWIAGIANIASGALSLIPHPIPKAIGSGIQLLGKNKLIQHGTNQIIKQIENKHNNNNNNNNSNLIEQVTTTTVEKCFSNNNNPRSNSTKAGSNATQGNYKPPSRKSKRPDRLAELAGQSMGSDSPWAKSKTKPARSESVTNM